MTPRERRPRVWVAVAAALVAMMAIGAAFVRLPYYAIAPGSARNASALVRVEGGPSHPPTGGVLLTTVSLGQVANVYEALDGWLDPAIDVVPEERILGSADRDEYQRQNAQAMTDSKDLAEYVALRRLGYDVAIHGEGALVVDVLAEFPAAGVLSAGDVVTAVGDRAVARSEDLVAAVQARKPGDAVRLRVAPAGATGQPREVSVTLAARDDGSPVLGVSLQTFRQRFEFPFRVEIDSGQIGGPSAGLAFTLAILDVLTPGELTGGQKVAATGTIDLDGRVGPVGGVAQKTVAVKRAGAALFLVPGAEYETALARAGKGLRVAKVDTLDDALAALATLDGSNATALPAKPGPA